MNAPEHYTTDLYRRAFHYAKGVSTDVRIFVGAMYTMMQERIWESGWVDKVSGETRSAPTLKEFIEKPVPRGIGQTIAWTYATFKNAGELGDASASKAIKLLNSQIKADTGETAEAIYLRAVRKAVPELPPAMTREEVGAKGGRGKKASSNRTSFSKGTTSAYTIARLKRDRPELAARVVSGELSANAAAVEAGFRRRPSPLEQILKCCRS